MATPLILVSIAVLVSTCFVFKIQAERKDEKFDWKSAVTVSIPLMLVFSFITAVMVNGRTGF